LINAESLIQVFQASTEFRVDIEGRVFIVGSYFIIERRSKHIHCFYGSCLLLVQQYLEADELRSYLIFLDKPLHDPL
jgi:hypothetical protein